MMKIPLKERLAKAAQPGGWATFYQICYLPVDDYFEALNRIPGEEATGSIPLIHRDVIRSQQKQEDTLAELVERLSLIPSASKLHYLYALLIFPIMILEEYL